MPINPDRLQVRTFRYYSDDLEELKKMSKSERNSFVRNLIRDALEQRKASSQLASTKER